MTSNSQKNNVRTIIITGCVILIVLMLSALILYLVKLGTLNSRKKELESKIVQANTEIAQLEVSIDEKSTKAFVDEYVRAYLDMCGEDEIVFIGK